MENVYQLVKISLAYFSIIVHRYPTNLQSISLSKARKSISFDLHSLRRRRNVEIRKEVLSNKISSRSDRFTAEGNLERTSLDSWLK